MRSHKINILMLSVGVITGPFRNIVDIINHINTKRFSIYVTYKPEFGKWGEHEIDSIRKTGSTIIPLRGNKLFDLRSYIDLWHTVRKERIDIIHCWDEFGIPARILAKFAGVKIVQEFASAPPVLNRDMSPAVFFANKITSILDDGFLSVSNEVLKEYKKNKPVFFNNKIISVVHNCVDIPALDKSKSHHSLLRRKYGINSNEIVLSNIGHFNAQKAQADLLRALKFVVEKIANVRLILVGWGPLERQLKTLTSELSLDEKVIFTGKLKRPQIFDILSITDLFVLSSHWEGLPIVIAEAMAAGNPVVSTSAVGCSEIVKNGETGIIAPINRPDILAEAILNLLSNPERMRQMGRRGLQRVTKYFNCGRFIKGYEEFYENVMKK